MYRVSREGRVDSGVKTSTMRFAASNVNALAIDAWGTPPAALATDANVRSPDPMAPSTRRGCDSAGNSVRTERWP
jgi:hypothetical protein